MILITGGKTATCSHILTGLFVSHLTEQKIVLSVSDCIRNLLLHARIQIIMFLCVALIKGQKICVVHHIMYIISPFNDLSV